MKDCHKNSCWKMPAKIIKIETGKPISICIHNCIATDSFPFKLIQSGFEDLRIGFCHQNCEGLKTTY